MKKIVYMIFILLLFSGCANSETDKSTEEQIASSINYIESVENNSREELNQESLHTSDLEIKADDLEMDSYDINMKRDLLSLLMAYPEFISSFEKDTSGDVYVIMKSGNKILYDDKISKTYEQKLANADLQDTMEMLYPLSDISELMDENYDPGRLRSYTLLKEIYGALRQDIEKSLEGVNIGGKVCSFNSKNGAAGALKQAAMGISNLAQNSKIHSSIFPVNGTYNYRVIAGTNQLSPHAFAIAIDFKSDKRDYWKWASRELGQQRLNEYPRDVVKILEENNFIWGGKWAHFDILHFEYRPELIIKAKYQVEDFEMGGLWYYGFPSQNEEVKSFIEIIEKI